MTSRQETSVRISVLAMERLSAITARAVSRDEAVRQLLEEHDAAQSVDTEEQRLTHAHRQP